MADKGAPAGELSRMPVRFGFVAKGGNSMHCIKNDDNIGLHIALAVLMLFALAGLIAVRLLER